MPKGQLSAEIISHSQFFVDPYLEDKMDVERLPAKASELVFHFSKLCAELPSSEIGLNLKKSAAQTEKGDMIAYRLTEKQLDAPLNFDTFFFDDYITCRVYHKNSTAKIHQIGKVKLYLRDLVFHDASLIHPCTLQNKVTGFEAGTIFLRFKYEAMPVALIDPAWK